MTNRHSESGFSIIELLVATAVLLIVSSIVTTALLQMTQAQTTIWNRTEMHSGIRGATELLQQEVGQAGRITLPGTVKLAAAVTATAVCDPGAPMLNAQTVGLTTSVVGGNATDGMWATAASAIMLTTFDGDTQESFRVGAINTASSPPTISACFTKAHAANAVIAPLGGFASGIVPDTGILNPSTPWKLKLYGDINGDGKMMYVEYTCDIANNKPYRNVMNYDTLPGNKPAVTDFNILLNNITDNPLSAPCFTYQTTALLVQGTPMTFVLDVAITLTVQTQVKDPITNQFQTETKALLNVSPRNVFNV
jgi:prepilin-type N-terminal cleavage/methylation domain-containing protein